MQLRKVKISNFRGIRALDWTCPQSMICLIGHGDSTKTTILDAIEYALGPRYGQSITETDFHLLDTSQPIRIEVTVGQLADSLIGQEKFGMYLRGWDPSACVLHDEPSDDMEPVLTVAVDVDASMEPRWHVITDRDPDGRDIPPRDRELFGVVRIGAEVDRHLTWSRGSALTRATESVGGVKRVLAEAHQRTREIIDQASLDDLRSAAKKAEEAGIKMGAIVREGFRPSLGGLPSISGYGFLSLHDGPPPLQNAGLGTRRLVALGLQTEAIPAGGIVLIDEVEHGLEPHRLRHVLKVLRPSDEHGQVLFSSHSPITLLELRANELQLVRCADGTTVVRQVPDGLQPLLRTMPSAFLSHRVLVGEGRTELGLCRGMEALWEAQCGAPLPHVGAIVVDGRGGGPAKQYAEQLSTLGFDAALLVDSDDSTLDLSETWQSGANVSVFSWAGECCTEVRVASDLPWAGIVQMVAIAKVGCGSDSLRARIKQLLPGQPQLQGDNPEDWRASGVPEADIRDALGAAANAHEWFKNIDLGERLGALLAEHWAALAGTPLERTLTDARDWLYGRAGHSTPAQ